jgi:hypothetical protein
VLAAVLVASLAAVLAASLPAVLVATLSAVLVATLSAVLVAALSALPVAELPALPSPNLSLLFSKAKSKAAKSRAFRTEAVERPAKPTMMSTAIGSLVKSMVEDGSRCLTDCCMHEIKLIAEGSSFASLAEEYMNITTRRYTINVLFDWQTRVMEERIKEKNGTIIY